MNQSEILIIGANGQLGQALQEQYPKAKTADIDSLDISDQKSVEGYDWSDVKVILNAAAYTNVDGAETPEGQEIAKKVNADAPRYLGEVCLKHGMTIVHISTDYVFDGKKNNHTEDEPFSPLSVYGSTKAEGDKAISKVPKHYILRTSWVIGNGKNFVRIMLELGKKGINPTVVADQIGRLTFASELARAIDHLLTTKPEYGTYNVTNGGNPTSWAEITRIIFKEAGLPNKVSSTTTADYFKDKPEAAKRPLLSSLDLSKIKATGFEPHEWRDDLSDYVKREMDQ